MKGTENAKVVSFSPLIDLRQWFGPEIGKKLKGVKGFNNSFNDTEKRSHISKIKIINQKKKKNEKLTTILKSFDTFVNVATTSSSITLSLFVISLIVIPISTGIVCWLTIGNKII